MTDLILPLDHPRFQRVSAAVFTAPAVTDCLAHRCAMVETGAHRPNACCQYGCDVDMFEREAILERAASIRPLLLPQAAAARWFDDEPEADPDFPSGRGVRTEVLDGGCIFLLHSGVGCAIHRAALEQGWDLRGVKPAVCRLFPLGYDRDLLSVAEEYGEYSCARAGAATLYRVARPVLADLFGEALVLAMDAVEPTALAAARASAPAGAAGG